MYFFFNAETIEVADFSKTAIKIQLVKRRRLGKKSAKYVLTLGHTDHSPRTTEKLVEIQKRVFVETSPKITKNPISWSTRNIVKTVKNADRRADILK